MNTRKTADYSPTMKGSKAENAAINARREMLNIFASIPPHKPVRRKTWEERMALRAGRSVTRSADGFVIRS